jgi:hypothetical protein
LLNIGKKGWEMMDGRNKIRTFAVLKIKKRENKASA